MVATTHLHDLHKPVDEDGPHADVDVVLYDLHVRRRWAPLQLHTDACFGTTIVMTKICERRGTEANMARLHGVAAGTGAESKSHRSKS